MRKRSQSSSQPPSLMSSSNSFFAPPPNKRARGADPIAPTTGSNPITGALGLALQASRRRSQPRWVTSSWRSTEPALVRKVTPLAMAGFTSRSRSGGGGGTSSSRSSVGTSSLALPGGNRKPNAVRSASQQFSSTSSSLWSKAIANKKKK